MGNTVAVTTNTWETDVINTTGAILVDFWAVWCGPCQAIAPTLEELAGEYQGKMKVCKVNTDENPDLASRYQIMGIPTLLFFKDGKQVDKIVGAASKKQIKDRIDRLLT